MFTLKMWDLPQMALLPQNWRRDIASLADSDAILTVLDGKSSTSREDGNMVPIEVSVVTGDVIGKKIPWLYALYAEKLRVLAEEVHQMELEVATDLPSSININVVKGLGSRYERHVDSNPVTGILYASTLREQDGGALVFDHPSAGSDVIYPREGLFIAFDATQTPHYVAPLQRETTRISLPMNYYKKGTHQKRPKDLGGYLYPGNKK